MQENPAISDWVPISGGSTEGLLGGRLAQRQAALREVMAAGALSTFTLGLPCVPVILRAACVPREKVFMELPRNSIWSCSVSLQSDVSI
jgi:hypothetical protein